LALPRFLLRFTRFAMVFDIKTWAGL